MMWQYVKRHIEKRAPWITFDIISQMQPVCTLSSAMHGVCVFLSCHTAAGILQDFNRFAQAAIATSLRGALLNTKHSAAARKMAANMFTQLQRVADITAGHPTHIRGNLNRESCSCCSRFPVVNPLRL